MSSIPQKEQESFEQSIVPDAYISKICKLFMDSLAHCPDPQILDVGPACTENISFLGRRVKKLFVCDMFTRLNRSRGKKDAMKKIWHSLDYPDQSFDGILLWDFIDRLDKVEAVEFVRQCRRLIRPRGSIMLAAYSRQTHFLNVHTFVLDKGFHISFRPQKQLELKVTYRHNREIMNMFAPLSLVKAQINKNGFREFLLQGVTE